EPSRIFSGTILPSVPSPFFEALKSETSAPNRPCSAFSKMPLAFPATPPTWPAIFLPLPIHLSAVFRPPWGIFDSLPTQPAAPLRPAADLVGEAVQVIEESLVEACGALSRELRGLALVRLHADVDLAADLEAEVMAHDVGAHVEAALEVDAVHSDVRRALRV